MSTALTLAARREKAPPPTLPLLTANDFTLLWACGFWDGPTSGILQYRGQEYGFEMIQQNDDEDLKNWYRRFAVVMLTPEQLTCEAEVQSDFCKHVGTNYDYRIPVEQRGYHRRDDRQAYYDKHLEFSRQNKYEDSRVIAWFQQ